MTYRKVGGLRFITIGPVGLTLWLHRPFRQRMAAMQIWVLTQGPQLGRMLVP